LPTRWNFPRRQWHDRYLAVNRRRRLHIQARRAGPLPAGQNAYERNNQWMLEQAARFGGEKIAHPLWNGEVAMARRSAVTSWTKRGVRPRGLLAGYDKCGIRDQRYARVFLIMPYGRQGEPGRAWTRTGRNRFNALWGSRYVPTIKSLGYDPGARRSRHRRIDIGPMLERLYLPISCWPT